MNGLFNASNLDFIEELYSEYKRHPLSVSGEWRSFFEKLDLENPVPTERPLRSLLPSSTLFNPAIDIQHNSWAVHTAALQERMDQLIRAYRVRGHMIAQVDPLGAPRPRIQELEPEFYGFTSKYMEEKFSCKSLYCAEALTLRQIIEKLRRTYCGSIGVQFMHMDESFVREWLQERMEMSENQILLSREVKLHILKQLINATTFEEFIRRKFVGAKSFSLEGAESLIPLLALAIERAGEQALDEIVLGMAHRGRLNVLGNIIGKSLVEIFQEFRDTDPQPYIGAGDVKYHLGFSNDWICASGRRIHLSLCFNPSHLEFVNAVAMGRMRAKQDRVGDLGRERGMVFLIHGDAAFAGEGVVQETLNLSQLEAYHVGGTLHIMINNQIGFTTSPSETKSGVYVTDIAKMLQIPIFHVNGEDPEAVAHVVRLAMDFRQLFRRDVVIDMYCYRRFGHNEGDEPSFTQPLMYRRIEKHLSGRDRYIQKLIEARELTSQEAENMLNERRNYLENQFSQKSPEPPPPRRITRGAPWERYRGGPENEAEDQVPNVEPTKLAALLRALTELPETFHPHPKIVRGLQNRREMAEGKHPLDWSAAEALALASIATEGGRVRLIGQDTARGTFSQRHAVLHDYLDDHLYVPLQHLSKNQAPIEIFNSPLSEAGALGFEYGYSLDYPDGLILWEAQFGDFCNAAQVIIDQFLTSAEDKWRRLSGLVLLLPHGYEGKGPEHSSARLERFLQLAAQDNIQIVYPTTPAQYFHCLRRQFLRPWRKPLVVLTPKSLLRHPSAVSSLRECSEGIFQRVIPDHSVLPEKTKKIILCTGKIFYELQKKREEIGRADTPIVRLEQLYPLSQRLLESTLAPYPEGTPVDWVQEEPENMGAWRHLRVILGEKLFNRWPLSGVYRPESGSPATGSEASHHQEQAFLLQEAFR